jgi:SAM-dependent methyltransferase
VGAPHEDRRRPHSRRADYKPSVPAEAFIVPLLERHIETFILSTNPTPGLKVLDVGCGNQPFRALIEERGYEYFGMDAVESPMCAINFVSPIDAELPEAVLRTGPFALILCTEVLEHVADWDCAFSNLARLLAPGGMILVTCPHFYPLHEEPFDFWRATRHAIAHFADAKGLSVREFRPLGGALDVLGTLLANIYFAKSSKSLSASVCLGACKVSRWILFFVLKQRIVQDRIASRGFYLSNFAILTHAAPVAQ